MNNFTRKIIFVCTLSALALTAWAQEPSNYPTAFTAATQSGTSIKLTWTGSTGPNLPNNYLILIRTVPAGTFSTPADGTAVADDSNLSDNLGAQNVTAATTTYTFTGLPTQTDFEFVIYPYKTGGAPDPDFKTSAGVPTATASTKVPTLTTPTATTIDENIATLGGTVTSNNGNTLTARGTVWKTSAGVTATDNAVAEGGTSVSTFTQARTGFPSGTKIYYAAYATSAAGTGLSPEASFFTLSPVPGAQPATVLATTVSSSQINLTFPAFTTLSNTNGYIILRRIGSAPATSSVQDGVAPASLSLGASTLVTIITNGVTTSFNDTGLSAGTDYFYAVVPFNWNTTDAETYNYKTSGGFTVDDDITFSGASDIILNGGTTAALDYRTKQSTTMNDDGSNSLSLATFQIRDGGATSDADNVGTRLTSLTVQLTNSSFVRRVALYDGSSEIAGTEQTVSGSTVTFDLSTYLLSASDGGTKSFTIRATFQGTVIDNQPVHVTITNAVAGNSAGAGSAFTAANAGGASSTSAAPTNLIDVDATLLAFSANPPDTPTSTNFSLTVKGVDSKGNTDLDYAGQIALSKSPASGNMTAGAQTLTPFLASGTYTWTQLQIDKAGTYTLTASDGAYLDNLSDGTATVNITSAGVTVTKPATLNLCYGGSYQALGNIVITETDPSDFSGSGNVSFSLSLPSGFAFDQSVTTAPLVTGTGSDITGMSTLSYPGSNLVQFTYNVNGTSHVNSITISGLKVRYPGNTAPGTTSIIRIGGTASVAGDPVGTVHGTVTAALGTPPATLGFTVSGDALVNPNETRFNKNSASVRLDGSPAGGVFSGSGVTFTSGEYRFNPSTLSAGNYPITYTYTDATAQQCSFTYTKTFEVYVTNITNLNLQYCNNDNASPPLSVSPTYISSRYPGYAFEKFVYYNYAGAGQTDMTSPAVNIFDPKEPTYQAVYSSTQTTYGLYGIWIGFVVRHTVLTTLTAVEWQFVQIRLAPTVTFPITKTAYCADEPPVIFTGSPANSNNTANDFFTATNSQQTSITSGGNPIVWTFNPSNVTGVSAGTPKTFDVTYTYTDPATGCSNTSLPVTIKVSARPTIVPAGNISPGTSVQICQGTAVPDFTAATVAGTTYTWYSNNPPTNVVGSGETFTPPVSNLIAGTSNFYVTRMIDGCESTQAPRQLTVVVNSSPAAPVADFSKEYCVNQTIPNSDLVVTGTNVRWYNANTSAFIIQTSNPTAAALGIDNTVAGTYSFLATQTISGCEGASTKITITVKPLPSLEILASITDVNKICITGGPVIFEARDAGLPAPNGTWSGSGGIGSALVPNPPAGTVQLNPAILSPGTYNLHLVYQNPSTACSNSKDLGITLLPTINPSVSIGTACNGLPVAITNNSVIVPNGSPTTIASTSWIFGDGASLVAGSGSVPAGTNSGRTTGTYFSPNHTFNGLGNFLMTYTMTTSDGCTVTPPQISVTVNPNPVSNFGWANVCYDATSGSNTNFLAVTANIPAADIQSYTWNFAKNNLLTIGTATGGKTPVVSYASVGTDSVQLIVTTVANCKDTVQKPVYIVPSYPAITEDNSYTQGFESGTDGWIAGGTNSSWAWGDPADSDPANNHGNLWDTNLSGISNNGEQSWVLSQCFDFTQSLKPIISLDIWSDTPAGNDGAVLQYNENGNIENDNNWIVIGQPGQGSNWYDESGISSSPGNQSANDVGWTGIYGKWKRATFKLDNLIGKSNIVFRIAFASNQPRRGGFAFDNIFIGERTRTVLLENFTNSNTASGANTRLHNDMFSNFSSNSPEIAKTEYHTSFPGEDPLNKANVEINNSRAAFYGITAAPEFAIDGTIVNTLGELTQLYNDRVLTPSPLRIIVNLVKDGDVVRIHTSLTNSSSTTFTAAGVNVFTAVVEKTITDAAYLGSNGDTEFKFVTKELLPTAAGVKLTQDIAPGETVALDEVVWSNRDLLTSGNGAIVIFVQSIEGGNKTVHQSKIVDATVEPELVTGTEHGLASQIAIYPNPARGTVNIQLPEAARYTMPINLMDGFGREVYTGNFAAGEKTKSINTTWYAAGIYILQVKAANGELIRKKVVVAEHP
ncbi:MAG TPA: T9SS type A sorting domain-containing protein [Ohtaekwangia sp.]|uniref:T9SS type A sorting domain-containing protein n=1 Tax=Ohtaekwangia sp. TaxID=2066019 RepID=UPI002F937320